MTDNKNTSEARVLEPGIAAPDFELRSAPGATARLSDYRGDPIILAFYPADWSPVCGDQIALYNEILPEFREYGAELLGISVDGIWCHAAFIKAKNIHFPLLSDFEPKGAVARSYGAYRQQDGTTERALFVVDREGIDLLELLLSGRRKSGSRWDSRGARLTPRARRANREDPDHETGDFERHGNAGMSHPLTEPVGKDDHSAGPDNAPITLVEYGDYECPHCGRAYPILKSIQRKLGNKLRFVFRNFPLSESHPHAEHAAEASEAAAAQKKFWPMHDTLFENQRALDDSDLMAYGGEIGLTWTDSPRRWRASGGPMPCARTSPPVFAAA